MGVRNVKETRTSANAGVYKRGFYLVLALLLVLVTTLVVLGFRLFGAVDDTRAPEHEEVAEQDALLALSVTPAQANTLLREVLNEEEDNLFTLQLEGEEVVLEGKMEVFGSSISIGMSFDPEVLADGNLRLHANDLRAGFLQLSASRALQWYQDYGELPGWLHVYPGEEMVDLRVTDIEEMEPYGIRVETMDLLEDQIELSLIRQENEAQTE